MTHAITAVQLAGGVRDHEHITGVQWLNIATGVSDQTTTSGMVKFIGDGNTVKVGGADGWATVEVVRPERGSPYLRSRKDHTITDNLLQLPRY